MKTANKFEDGFAPNAANYVPLSPLSFLKRTAGIWPHRESVIYGSQRFTWAETYQRCIKLASALTKRGFTEGATISLVTANTPEMVECHFGVPMAQAVLNTINVRLDSDTLSYIFDHAETDVLIVDGQFAPAVRAALAQCENKGMLIVDVIDPQSGLPEDRVGSVTYEELLAEGDDDFDWQLPSDEWQALSLNYTSGTSGRPKGVVYHHRGSYLMTMGTVIGWDLPQHPRYLYTVPMFHCNGWGHAWTMTALAGTIVCNRNVAAGPIYEALAEHKITHFGGAPIVLSMLINATDEERRALDHPIKVMTAGAPPPATVLAGIEKMGMEVLQVYGLTETYGHVIQSQWQGDLWDALPFDQQATLKARQGVTMPMNEEICVVDQDTGERVPRDGETMGEILIRGNTVMKGYLKNPDATAEAFDQGWYHSGDIAVCHPDGYVEVKDRLKDIIISGGENISSVEVEGVLHKHPCVALAAVVARPDERWGEHPAAFVELKPGTSATADEIIAFCRDHLAGFKRPKTVVFGELPKTATGKIQKFELRKAAKDMGVA